MSEQNTPRAKPGYFYSEEIEFFKVVNCLSIKHLRVVREVLDAYHEDIKEILESVTPIDDEKSRLIAYLRSPHSEIPVAHG